MSDFPDCFYRISIKALILNETRDKFLICQDEKGLWDLPGGGLDYGTTPQEDLPREIGEEMGLAVTYVAPYPSYFVSEQLHSRVYWKACVVYEAGLEHLEFTPSDECVNIRFVDQEDLKDLPLFACVEKVATMFKPENHV